MLRIGVVVEVTGLVMTGIVGDSVGDCGAMAVGVGHGRRHVLTVTNGIDPSNGFMRHRKLSLLVSDDFLAGGE